MRKELQSVLQIANELPHDELPTLLGELEELRLRLQSLYTSPTQARSFPPDQNLKIDEAAGRLKMSTDYLYRHKDEFEFTRRIGRKLLFSSSGIDEYIRRPNRRQDSLTARRRRVNLVAL